MARYKVLSRIDRGLAANGQQKITVFFPKDDLAARGLRKEDLGLPPNTDSKIDCSGQIELTSEQARQLILERVVAPRTAGEKKLVEKKKHPRDPEDVVRGPARPSAASAAAVVV